MHAAIHSSWACALNLTFSAALGHVSVSCAALQQESAVAVQPYQHLELSCFSPSLPHTPTPPMLQLCPPTCQSRSSPGCGWLRARMLQQAC
jgi:hypothetical protein